jgi:hypothetical protein
MTIHFHNYVICVIFSNWENFNKIMLVAYTVMNNVFLVTSCAPFELTNKIMAVELPWISTDGIQGKCVLCKPTWSHRWVMMAETTIISQEILLH